MEDENGQNINFWHDNWHANDSLANLLGISDYVLIDASLRESHFITKDKE